MNSNLLASTIPLPPRWKFEKPYQKQTVRW